MFELCLIAVFVLLITYYFQYRKKWLAKFGQFDQLPGPRTWPLIGNVWRIILVPRQERMKYFENNLIGKYGPLFKMWLGSNPSVICANAEDAEVILSSRTNIEKSSGYNFLMPWLGTGLLTSGGSKWHQRRKLLTPAFHFSILESFLPIMTEHSRTFVEKLSTLENIGAESNVFTFVHRFTFDVICETAMGVKLDVQNRESPEYLENVLSMSIIIMKKLLTPWWHNKYLYSFSNLYREEQKTLGILHSMSMDIIQKNKQKRLAENVNPSEDSDINEYGIRKRKAFLDLLLDISEDSQTPLTDEDVREEVDTFMFEGHDTTTSGILSTIHFLSTHPKVQDKVADELFSVFGDSDRDPSLQDISELKYLDCVIKESHRLLPPVPAISRRLSEPVVLGGKYTIPAGTLVEVNIFHIHRQETNFPNPREFNPNNFASENTHNRHPFAYVPFSAGSRNCIGQKFAMLEEKVLLSFLLRKYEIRSSQKLEDLGLCSELVLRHDNGVFISLKPRTWEKM